MYSGNIQIMTVLNITAFLVAVVAVITIYKLIREKHYPTIASQQSIDEALKIVKDRGYTIHLYLPTTGVDQNDKDLVNAIRFLHSIGNIITDVNGNLVGKVATEGLSADEIAKIRRKEFKCI